jgi:hypothetical protein
MKQLKFGELVLLIVVFGLVVEVAFLMKKYQMIQVRLSAVETRIAPPVLKTGDRVPPFGVTGLNGEKKMITYSGKTQKTVLFSEYPVPGVREKYPLVE